MKRRKKNRVTAVLLRIRRTENQEKKEKPTGGTEFTGSLQPLDSCLLLPKFSFFLLLLDPIYSYDEYIKPEPKKKK